MFCGSTLPADQPPECVGGTTGRFRRMISRRDLAGDQPAGPRRLVSRRDLAGNQPNCRRRVINRQGGTERGQSVHGCFAPVSTRELCSLGVTSGRGLSSRSSSNSHRLDLSRYHDSHRHWPLKESRILVPAADDVTVFQQGDEEGAADGVADGCEHEEFPVIEDADSLDHE